MVDASVNATREVVEVTAVAVADTAVDLTALGGLLLKAYLFLITLQHPLRTSTRGLVESKDPRVPSRMEASSTGETS